MLGLPKSASMRYSQKKIDSIACFLSVNAIKADNVLSWKGLLLCRYHLRLYKENKGAF